jgi:hypothetical protein
LKALSVCVWVPIALGLTKLRMEERVAEKLYRAALENEYVARVTQDY